MNALHSTQEPRRATMMHTMTSHTFTMRDVSTDDAVTVTVLECYPNHHADIAAWPARFDRTMAERYDILAAATLARDPLETPEAFTKRIHNEAAILGMDTLRELSRPLYREPSTAGES